MNATSPALLLALTCSTLPAVAQTPPDYDFSWATVSDAGNAPYTGPDPYNIVAGRGSVAYDYRISRLEITTAQWMEYVNTYSTLGGTWTYFAEPNFWGAEPDPNYTGLGRRYELRDTPDASMLPVVGLSWRDAAMYCNWLTNGKNPATSSLASGAYDTSTFTFNANGTFNDQRTHSPGALFWIPTLDEWMKAAHYDPNRYGTGHGGWWQFPNGSDEPLISGPPGQGQTDAGLEGSAELYDIPLGAYPTVQTPWGLLDASGGTEEWIEEVTWPDDARNRGLEGTWVGIGPSFAEGDRVYVHDSLSPGSHLVTGLRIASAIPAPSGGLVLVSSVLMTLRRRRK